MIYDIEGIAHYSRLENLEKILKDKHIRFGPVSKVNDLREKSLDWIDICGYGDDSNIPYYEQAIQVKKNIGDNLRLFCASYSYEDDLACVDSIESKPYGKPRMWAQYGDNSKGFCIILDKNKFHNEVEKQVSSSEYLIANKVEYIDWLSIINGGATIEYGDGIEPNEANILSIINKNHMLRYQYFRKNIDWSDEKEYRWLMYTESKKDKLLSIENSINAVILGCDFPVERYPDVKNYCIDLNCSCFILYYQHPVYKLNRLV